MCSYADNKHGIKTTPPHALRYALGSLLQSRNLSFSQITVTDPIAEPGEDARSPGIIY